MLLPPAPKQPTKPDPLERLLKQPAFDCLPIAVVDHAQAVPLGILVRGTLEWVLDKPTLEQLFQLHATEQYTRELTISAMVGLLIQVAAGLRRSVFAASKADHALAEPSISISYQALYGKLGRMEPAVTEAVVRHSAEKLGTLLDLLPAATEDIVPGYRLRVLDGNVLTGTDHRVGALRRWLNACLPGKSLVIYEPARGLVTDLVLCEDAYTQERALLTHVVDRLQANDLVVADRNFCTRRFVFGTVAKQAFFVVRQQARNVPCQALGKSRKCGQTETGVIYEQRVRVSDPKTGVYQILRRIKICLFEKTRDGERTIPLLTNRPEEVTAVQIAEVYRQRWTIETQFQFLTESLHCEIPGLGKPRAALFMFAMALVASNVLAVVRGSVRAAHGRDVERAISGYYLADEIAFDYRVLMKYLPADQWVGWQSLPAKNMARLRVALAGKVNVKALTRSKRGPKKPPKEKPVYNKKHKHYSTARLLNEAKDTC
jgi:IS4 transposase